jgi:hypothetical protein
VDHWNAEIPPVRAGDELAACLARFLDARVDERTMERAREALARWHELTAPEPVGAGVP